MTKKGDEKGKIVDGKLGVLQGMVDILIVVGYNMPYSVAVADLILGEMGREPVDQSFDCKHPNKIRDQLAAIGANVAAYDRKDYAGERKGIAAALAVIKAEGYDPGDAGQLIKNIDERESPPTKKEK